MASGISWTTCKSSAPHFRRSTTPEPCHSMTENSVWSKLSQESRHFLRSLSASNIVNESSIYVVYANYSAVVDELILLLPVPSPDLVLPRSPLCADTGTTQLFTSVSGLQKNKDNKNNAAEYPTGRLCLLPFPAYWRCRSRSARPPAIACSVTCSTCAAAT